jgi:site-specific DNA recombinase
MRLVVASDQDSARPARHDSQLIRAIARGYVWYERLISGDVASIWALAQALQVDERYVSRILRGALLAPDLIAAILEGRQPPHLTVAALRFGAPLLWAEQRARFSVGSA